MRSFLKLTALLLALVLVLGMLPATHAHSPEQSHVHGIEEYPEIGLDTDYVIDVTSMGQEFYFRFTPTVTEGYCFSSASDLETVGAIFDSEMNQLAYDDSSAYTDCNFYVGYDLEAGKTYVFATQLHSNYQTGSYTVRLSLNHSYEAQVTKEATCTEEGLMTYTCRYCGDVTTRAIPMAHKFEDGVCVWCGLEFETGGTCEDGLTWRLDYTGTLTISGVGAMKNYDSYKSPWDSLGEQVRRIVVEEGVTRVGHYAFMTCWNAEEISLPNSLRTIGIGVLKDSQIAELTIPKNVTAIENFAFWENAMLETLTLPSGLKSVGVQAFANCTSLKEIILPDSLTEYGNSVFMGCTALERAVLPTFLETIPDTLFAGCENLHEIVWPVNVKVIDEGAFGMCGLTELRLPEGLTTISASGFGENRSLTSVEFPESVTTVGGEAFKSCYELKKLIFHGDAPTIGENAFRFVTADAWYPAGNETWTEDVLLDYGEGTLTWHAMCAVHSYGDWVVSGGSCTEPGIETRTCTVCSWSESRPQAQASGHRYEAVITGPTCTEPGFTTYTCLSCGDSYVSDELPALGHDYAAVVTDPTCTEGGFTTYTCALCGDHYVADRTDASGHAFTDWSEPTEGSCTDDRVRSRSCTACGMTETEVVAAAPGHQYASTIKEPTCTEEGYTLYTCSVCGDSYTKYHKPASGHTMQTIASTPATCTEGRYFTNRCYYCGYEEREYVSEPLGHDLTSTEIAATCTEPGYTHSTCTRCDYEEKTQTAPALGHNLFATVVVPTCTEDGYNLYTCTRCDYTKKDDFIPAYGHKWEDGKCSYCGISQGSPFTDVPEGSFYYEPVLWAVERNITTGATDTTFNPDGQCLRAHVVTFLWRAEGCPEPTATENPFTDVNPSDFYYKAVLWAVEKGITNGADATHFNPFGVCNRAQVVTFLHRAKGSPAPESLDLPFADVPEGVWYAAPVAWAVETGVTNGLSATQFGPEAACNRAQVVTFLYRAYHS